MKRYRTFAPLQPFILPPSPQEWLPAGHLAFFVLKFVEELDLGAIERRVQSKDPRGERPYAPRMLVGLLLYGYATGVSSSRRIERATVEDVAFRVLAGGERPHFTTINEFRANHREALAALFDQVLEACESAGLVKLQQVAIDGTKMKANASMHKAMSHDRMIKDRERLRAEVEGWLQPAGAADAEEDAVHGPYDPQAEIRLREERLAKAEAATLAKKRTQQALALGDDDQDPPPPPGPDDDLPRNSPPAKPDGTLKPKAQRNFTDPQSRTMLRTAPSSRLTTRSSLSTKATRSSSRPR